jgi:hypothetical protein
MDPINVLTAFHQGAKNNCATIAIIKVAIATFGLENVFEHKYDESVKLHTVTLKNQKQFTFTESERINLSDQSGFILKINPDQIHQQIYDYAILCFVAIVKYYMKLENLTAEESLIEINRKGINSDFAFLNLGFNENQIRFLTEDNNGTAKPEIYATNLVYMFYNNNHAVMATLDKYDEYGIAINLNQLVRNHSSFFKPGKICWAYTFI